MIIYVFLIISIPLVIKLERNCMLSEGFLTKELSRH